MARLPPFDGLIAFDAVVRHGSMTRAASELGLTQSAVSHRIRRLQVFMGTPLLERNGSGLVPTEAGVAMGDGLTALLADLAGLRGRALAAAAPDRLRVGVGAALADNWLVRRLPAFTSAHPWVSIELVVVENESPERIADLHFRILWVPVGELRATTTQRPLFRERVFPVCHPSLLPSGSTPGDPNMLLRLPLLHKGPRGRPAGAAEWSWPAWFDRLGLTARPKESLRFGAIGPAIAAAHQGAGVVLARSMLVHDALAEGRLVRVLRTSEDMLSSKAHVARWPAALHRDERVRGFAAWLTEKAQDTASSEALTA